MHSCISSDQMESIKWGGRVSFDFCCLLRAKYKLCLTLSVMLEILIALPVQFICRRLLELWKYTEEILKCL